MSGVSLLYVNGQNNKAAEIRAEKVRIARADFILSMPDEIQEAYIGLGKMGEKNITWYINENWPPVRARDLADMGTKAKTMEEALMLARASAEEMPKDVNLRSIKEQNMERFSRLSIESKEKEIRMLQRDNKTYEDDVKNKNKTINEYFNKLQSIQKDEISKDAINSLKDESMSNIIQADNSLKERQEYLNEQKKILEKECPSCVV